MRVADNKELKGLDLFNHLRENKDEIVKAKKSMPISSDSFAVDTSKEYIKDSTVIKTKSLEAKGEDESDELDSLNVKVVANMSMVCDSHQDVLAPDCWKKTIKERQNVIPHLHDHKHTIEAKVGIVKRIFSEMIDLKKIGVKSNVKEAQALVFETEIKKDFNKKIFELYKSGEVNQHSIGLQYIKIDLAVNSEDSDFKQEFKLWNKHINDIVNPDSATERGYFWYVSEIKLFENSAVLFGSNEITPTLEVEKIQPISVTEQKEPLKDTQEENKSLTIYDLI